VEGVLNIRSAGCAVVSNKSDLARKPVPRRKNPKAMPSVPTPEIILKPKPKRGLLALSVTGKSQIRESWHFLYAGAKCGRFSFLGTPAKRVFNSLGL
jgi:hypothetical protein